jgi:hypothetical protein
MGGHGYALVTARPTADLRLRLHPAAAGTQPAGRRPPALPRPPRGRLWAAGATPKLSQTVLEGDPGCRSSRAWTPARPRRQVGGGGQLAQGLVVAGAADAVAEQQQGGRP